MGDFLQNCVASLEYLDFIHTGVLLIRANSRINLATLHTIKCNLVQNKLKFSEKLFKKNFKVGTFAFIITRTFKYFAVRFHEVATIFVEGPELLM